MNRKARNIAAVVSLASSFAGVGAICLYMGYNHGQDQADQDAFEAGYQSFQDELTACHDAKREAGIALGNYILGENEVTESDLDEAEANAEELCEKFEFNPD